MIKQLLPDVYRSVVGDAVLDQVFDPILQDNSTKTSQLGIVLNGSVLPLQSVKEIYKQVGWYDGLAAQQYTIRPDFDYNKYVNHQRFVGGTKQICTESIRSQRTIFENMVNQLIGLTISWDGMNYTYVTSTDVHVNFLTLILTDGFKSYVTDVTWQDSIVLLDDIVPTGLTLTVDVTATLGLGAIQDNTFWYKSNVINQVSTPYSVQNDILYDGVVEKCVGYSKLRKAVPYYYYAANNCRDVTHHWTYTAGVGTQQPIVSHKASLLFGDWSRLGIKWKYNGLFTDVKPSRLELQVNKWFIGRLVSGVVDIFLFNDPLADMGSTCTDYTEVIANNGFVVNSFGNRISYSAANVVYRRLDTTLDADVLSLRPNFSGYVTVITVAGSYFSPLIGTTSTWIEPTVTSTGDPFTTVDVWSYELIERDVDVVTPLLPVGYQIAAVSNIDYDLNVKYKHIEVTPHATNVVVSIPIDADLLHVVNYMGCDVEVTQSVDGVITELTLSDVVIGHTYVFTCMLREVDNNQYYGVVFDEEGLVMPTWHQYTDSVAYVDRTSGPLVADGFNYRQYVDLSTLTGGVVYADGTMAGRFSGREFTIGDFTDTTSTANVLTKDNVTSASNIPYVDIWKPTSVITLPDAFNSGYQDDPTPNVDPLSGLQSPLTVLPTVEMVRTTFTNVLTDWQMSSVIGRHVSGDSLFTQIKTIHSLYIQSISTLLDEGSVAEVDVIGRFGIISLATEGYVSAEQPEILVGNQPAILTHLGRVLYVPLANVATVFQYEQELFNASVIRNPTRVIESDTTKQYHAAVYDPLDPFTWSYYHGGELHEMYSYYNIKYGSPFPNMEPWRCFTDRKPVWWDAVYGGNVDYVDHIKNGYVFDGSVNIPVPPVELPIATTSVLGYVPGDLIPPLLVVNGVQYSEFSGTSQVLYRNVRVSSKNTNEAILAAFFIDGAVDQAVRHDMLFSLRKLPVNTLIEYHHVIESPIGDLVNTINFDQEKIGPVSIALLHKSDNPQTNDWKFSVSFTGDVKLTSPQTFTFNTSTFSAINASIAGTNVALTSELTFWPVSTVYLSGTPADVDYWIDSKNFVLKNTTPVTTAFVTTWDTTPLMNGTEVRLVGSTIDLSDVFYVKVISDVVYVYDNYQDMVDGIVTDALVANARYDAFTRKRTFNLGEVTYVETQTDDITHTLNRCIVNSVSAVVTILRSVEMFYKNKGITTALVEDNYVTELGLYNGFDLSVLQFVSWVNDIHVSGFTFYVTDRGRGTGDHVVVPNSVVGELDMVDVQFTAINPLMNIAPLIEGITYNLKRVANGWEVYSDGDRITGIFSNFNVSRTKSGNLSIDLTPFGRAVRVVNSNTCGDVFPFDKVIPIRSTGEFTLYFEDEATFNYRTPNLYTTAGLATFPYTSLIVRDVNHTVTSTIENLTNLYSNKCTIDQQREMLGFTLEDYAVLDVSNVSTNGKLEIHKALSQVKGTTSSLRSFLNVVPLSDVITSEYWMYKVASFGKRTEVKSLTVNGISPQQVINIGVQGKQRRVFSYINGSVETDLRFYDVNESVIRVYVRNSVLVETMTANVLVHPVNNVVTIPIEDHVVVYEFVVTDNVRIERPSNGINLSVWDIADHLQVGYKQVEDYVIDTDQIIEDMNGTLLVAGDTPLLTSYVGFVAPLDSVDRPDYDVVYTQLYRVRFNVVSGLPDIPLMVQGILYNVSTLSVDGVVETLDDITNLPDGEYFVVTDQVVREDTVKSRAVQHYNFNQDSAYELNSSLNYLIYFNGDVLESVFDSNSYVMEHVGMYAFVVLHDQQPAVPWIVREVIFKSTTKAIVGQGDEVLTQYSYLIEAANQDLLTAITRPRDNSYTVNEIGILPRGNYGVVPFGTQFDTSQDVTMTGTSIRYVGTRVIDAIAVHTGSRSQFDVWKLFDPSSVTKIEYFIWEQIVRTVYNDTGARSMEIGSGFLGTSQQLFREFQDVCGASDFVVSRNVTDALNLYFTASAPVVNTIAVAMLRIIVSVGGNIMGLCKTSLVGVNLEVPL